MNRLQKKCVIATAGFHLLLLVILFVGPAFFNSKPKVDDSQVLDVIPANLIDAAFNSGVKGAQPPPPTPIVTPPQPTPIPPAPKQIVQPAPAPQPTITERLEKFFTPAPVKPAPAPVENQPHTPKVDLHLVTRNAPKNSTTTKPKQNSQAAKNLAAELRSKLSTATQIDMPGESSAAYANYASVVKSIYDQAWTLPDSVANDDENVKVSVTIASDGTVISSHIITPSGDASVDNSVQRTLDRVTFIAPFPEGVTDKERTYTINFNPQLKRLSE
ncbi:MAG TPA: TonB family protein [Dongiaceae bacterium]|nr:TonB family protein [Dongiaceae bacterium]